MNLLDLFIFNVFNNLPCLAQIIGFVLISPPFNARFLPVIVKIMFVLSFWVGVGHFEPNLHLNADTMDYYLVIFTSISRLLLGLSIGFLIFILFSCLDWMGELISNSLGLSMPGQYDPLHSLSAGPIAAFSHMFSILLFVEMGGLEVLLSLIQTSLEIDPSLSMIPHVKISVLEYLKNVGTFSVEASFLLWGGMFLANFLMLIISRLSGGLNLMSSGLPLLLALGLSLYFFNFLPLHEKVMDFIFHHIPQL